MQAAGADRRIPVPSLARQERRFALALFAPAFLVLLLTTTAPLVYLAWTSLHRIDLGMPWLSGFAGLGNYVKMGEDPEKLLPKPRIDEIAAAVQVGDLDGARQVVKRLAPAATRRIVRRLFTDEALRGQVTAYIRRYQGLVDDAVVRDPEGFLMAELLGGEAGRLYLLLDAAVGDMA